MDNLTTQESIKIIQSVIDKRKQVYEQNGIFLMIWGALIALAGLSQFVMIRMGHANIAGYAWLFTMVPGAIITFIVKFAEGYKRGKRQESSDVLGWIWAVAGTLAMLTGFFFGSKFGMGFTTIIYLPFGMAALASALIIKNRLWIVLSLAGIALAYGVAFIPFMYHPMVAAGIATLLFLIPGIQLFINYRKRQHV